MVWTNYLILLYDIDYKHSSEITAATQSTEFIFWDIDWNGNMLEMFTMQGKIHYFFIFWKSTGS